jgi:GR25 family glycosyltransferase involved in LPS biosynthesis
MGDYYRKYLKYKSKYTILKKQKGGNLSLSTFIVHCKRDSHRMEGKKVPVNVSVSECVDARSLNLKDTIEIGESITSETAIYLSHLNIWLDFLEKTESDYLFVMEDDAIWNDKIIEAVHELLNKFPQEGMPSLIYLWNGFWIPFHGNGTPLISGIREAIHKKNDSKDAWDLFVVFFLSKPIFREHMTEYFENAGMEDKLEMIYKAEKENDPFKISAEVWIYLTACMYEYLGINLPSNNNDSDSDSDSDYDYDYDYDYEDDLHVGSYTSMPYKIKPLFKYNSEILSSDITVALDNLHCLAGTVAYVVSRDFVKKLVEENNKKELAVDNYISDVAKINEIDILTIMPTYLEGQCPQNPFIKIPCENGMNTDTTLFKLGKIFKTDPIDKEFTKESIKLIRERVKKILREK